MNDHMISWSAPEYEHREHSADWYWALGIITVSLAIAFVILGNTLLSIIIVVGIGTLLLYAKQVPKNIDCTISKRGISAGKTLYPWESLASFWILERDDSARFSHGPKVLLTSKKQFMLPIVIPLPDSLVEEVHQTLGELLHESPQIEPLADRLMRAIGF